MEVSRGELLQLRDVIQGYSGIRLEESKLEFLKDRLIPVARAHGASSMAAFSQMLLKEMAFGMPKAWNDLMPLVTINETYFFREMNQLELFKNELIPEIVKRKTQRRLRILSAPCSSGEEPYTIAMLLDEAPVSLAGWQVEIWGVDIDGPVIQKAQAGLYPRSAFRATDGKYLSKYFTQEGDFHRVGSRLAGRVKFKQGNLFEMGKWPGFTDFDVIFCRNMLIYFDKPTQKRMVEIFHRAMVPGGYLLIGHSESLLSLEVDFMLRSNKQAIYYEAMAPSGKVRHV